MMMIDYNTNELPIIGQRRKSSPECLFRFKAAQKPEDSVQWIKPNIFKDIHPKTRPSSFYCSSSSILLPAAPVVSNFSSLKKRKRLLQRTSFLKDDFFEMPKANTRTDIELATEIGQGLLSEVRRMQTLLSERQSTLNQLTTEKQENQSRIQHLVKQLRYKSEIEEKLKQELWNLELAKQDLNSNVNQLSAAIQKAQLEQDKRDQKDSLVQQELRVLKQAQDQWKEVLQKTESDYEAKLTLLHQSLSQLTQEKDTITQQLTQLKEDHTLVVPLKTQEKPSEEELRGLQVSLAEANHVVETLQMDLEKEKSKKQELDQLLRESKETIEHLQTMEMPVHPLMMVPDSKFRKVLPFVVHTMMGEWMCKYTRYRASHHRFFWLHPYTKMLYWCQQELIHSGEYKAKSALIESFHIESSSDIPIIVIKSSKRDIRIQCLEKESHEIWLQSLTYLFEKEQSSTKSNKLSLLLENHPPNTMKRMSFQHIQEKPQHLRKRPHSMIFGSLRISNKTVS